MKRTPRSTNLVHHPGSLVILREAADRRRSIAQLASSRSVKAVLAHADAIERADPTVSPAKARSRPTP